MLQMELIKSQHHRNIQHVMFTPRVLPARRFGHAVAAPVAAPSPSGAQDHTIYPKRPRTVANAFPAGVEHLLADSAAPILKICGLSGVGAFCAKQGMIDVEARRTLSKLAINVFTPALMISKLGAYIDLHKALTLWPIGANVITSHLVGLAMGILLTNLLQTPPHLRKIVRVSTAISNVGNLPLVMVLSFVKNPNLLFNTTSEAELAVSYVMLGWFYATMIQMPLGHLLLHKDPQAVATVVSSSSSSHTAEQQVPAAAAATATAAAGAPGSDAYASLQDVKLQLELMFHLQSHVVTTGAAGSSSSSSRRAYMSGGGVATAAAAAAAAPAAAVQPPAAFLVLDALPYFEGSSASSSSSATVTASSSSSSSSGGRGATAASVNSSSSSSIDHHVHWQSTADLQQQQQQWQQWQQQWQQELQPLMRGVVSPPLVAGLVAIAIGSCPPLRDSLFNANGSLSLIGDCIDMLGQPLIPILLLVLGANLANGPGQANIPWKSVAGVVAARLLLLPAVGCMAVLTAQRTGLIDMQDPLTLIVMMVSWSTPTAILVHSLASIHHNGEDEVSALLFWEYLACIATLPLCSAVYLYLLGCCMTYAA